MKNINKRKNAQKSRRRNTAIFYNKYLDFRKVLWYMFVLQRKECNAMTILEDLYFGNVRPWERPVKKESKEQNAVLLMVNNEEKLRATLTEQQKEMLEKYRDSYNELMSICEREAFSSGFTLAIKIMVEVMQGLTEVEDI